eukprot:83312-Chlamydomonas_euryale.AAC.4
MDLPTNCNIRWARSMPVGCRATLMLVSPPLCPCRMHKPIVARATAWKLAKLPFSDWKQPPSTPRYEFVAPNGIHVFMSVAAQRGRLYVCSCQSSSTSAWADVQATAEPSIYSFRLKTEGSLGPRL